LKRNCKVLGSQSFISSPPEMHYNCRGSGRPGQGLRRWLTKIWAWGHNCTWRLWKSRYHV